jgi:hypothetical protein
MILRFPKQDILDMLQPISLIKAVTLPTVFAVNQTIKNKLTIKLEGFTVLKLRLRIYKI